MGASNALSARGACAKNAGSPMATEARASANSPLFVFAGVRSGCNLNLAERAAAGIQPVADHTVIAAEAQAVRPLDPRDSRPSTPRTA